MAAIEAADGRRALALDLASLAAAALAVGLLARQSLLRRREGQRSRERLADVLGNAPVGLGFLDPDLTLRHANRALAEMMGRGRGARRPALGRGPALEGRLRPALEAARGRAARRGPGRRTSALEPGRSRRGRHRATSGSASTR